MMQYFVNVDPKSSQILREYSFQQSRCSNCSILVDPDLDLYLNEDKKDDNGSLSNVLIGLHNDLFRQLDQVVIEARKISIGPCSVDDLPSLPSISNNDYQHTENLSQIEHEIYLDKQLSESPEPLELIAIETKEERRSRLCREASKRSRENQAQKLNDLHLAFKQERTRNRYLDQLIEKKKLELEQLREMYRLHKLECGNVL